MKSNHLSPSMLAQRIIFAISFTITGLLIILVFNPYRPILPLGIDLIGRTILISVLAIVSAISRKIKVLTIYQNAIYGLLILAVAVSAVWIFACFLLNTININSKNPSGFALLKLSECIVIAITVILLNKSSGQTFGSLYLQKGNLKKGLTIGIVAFIITATGSIFISPLFFGAGELSSSKVLAWLPWIFIFVFANAFGEELLYRGLFLRRLEPLYGKFFSNILIVLIFTLLHMGVTYSRSQLLFLIVLTPLAFFWGYLIQKTDSLISSVFFHAGMDVAIILGIFSNLTNG